MLKPDTFALTAALGLLSSLGPLSTDMYLPSLPAIGRALGADPPTLQLTLSLYLLGFAAGQIVYGPIADRRGRKPVLLAGLGLYVVGSVGCAAAPGIETLILARIVQAFGSAGPIVLARAVVRDLFEGPRAARELARMGAIMGLVPAVAPTIGGFIQAGFGWRAVFAAAALFGLAAIVLVGVGLPETLERRETRRLSFSAIVAGFRGLLRHPGYRAHVGIVCATYGGLFAFISASSFVLQDIYGLSEIEFGIAFGCGAGAYVSGTLIGQRVVMGRGIAATIALGAAAMAFGGLTMVAGAASPLAHPAALVLPMMVYMVGVGLTLPQAMAGVLMPFPDRAGSASSLAGFLQMICAAAIGLVIGQTIGGSAMPLALAVAAAGLVSLAVERTTRAVRRI